MSTRNSAPYGNVFGLADWIAWLDRTARAIYGVSGAEFEAAFEAGMFAPPSVADDLGSVLPLIRRLRERDRTGRLTA